MSIEQEILNNISRKLDTLITLLKISNRTAIQEYRKQIQQDNVLSKILELSDGSLTYSDLSRKVAESANVAEITVKKKLSELKEAGVLVTVRKGKEAYYERSGVFE